MFPLMKERRFLRAMLAEEFTTLLETVDLSSRDDENISLSEAIGRIVAQDITSDINVPSFPKSSVDGYAVQAKGTFSASGQVAALFSLAGTVEMGTAPDFTIEGPETCAYVPTGGFVPPGADAMVKIEYTKVIPGEHGELGAVEISQPVAPGDGVVQTGADFKAGALLLRAGTVITPPRAGTLAAAGITTVDVVGKLKAGLFSSGNEIVEPGNPLDPGKIYDVNSVVLQALLRRAGCEVNRYGVVPDDLATLERTFSTALDENDLLLCSGGTSKGRGDLMPDFIESHPLATIQVHGVRIKPGKPIIFAMLGEKPVFVLPGNPTSAVITFVKFVEPSVLRWNGLPVPPKQVTRATLAERVYVEYGRRELKPVQLVDGPDGELVATPVAKGSETITTLVDADGYFEIPENVERVEKGTIVDVIYF